MSNVANPIVVVFADVMMDGIICLLYNQELS